MNLLDNYEKNKAAAAATRARERKNLAFSPLLDTIIERDAIAVLNKDNIGSFLKENGDVILFLAGDFKRLVEVNDVAVILPELVKASNGVLTPAVVQRDYERETQKLYNFDAFPALVFLRNGDYLGCITRVLDWGEYITEINDILSRSPSEPPSSGGSVGCNTKT